VADPRLSGVSDATAGPQQPVFYYDLGSPRCYIVAETIMTMLPVVPEWEPVLGSELEPFGPEGVEREDIERLAAEHGLQPVRWPSNWPPDSARATLAATYAKRIGRVVAFSLAAFRQAFAGGRDLGDEDTILIAGAACEMHPAALRKGIELTGTQTALRSATRRAQAAGVARLPAIQVGERVYAGLEAIDGAAVALQTT
jgi:2-hydroxychromene-2-carboxylate isomerase